MFIRLRNRRCAIMQNLSRCIESRLLRLLPSRFRCREILYENISVTEMLHAFQARLYDLFRNVIDGILEPVPGCPLERGQNQDIAHEAKVRVDPGLDLGYFRAELEDLLSDRTGS